MTFEERQQELEKLLLVYQKYVLVKKAKLWSLENNEYAYFYLTDKLDLSCFEHIQKVALDAGMELVHPHSEHMSSLVTLVILADEIDNDAKAALKKLRFEKSFRLSLHGWMEFRIAAINFSDGEIISNRAGKDVRELLEQNLQS